MKPLTDAEKAHGKCVVELVKMRKLLEAAGLSSDLEKVIGGLFLFVPENEKGGANVLCFKVASIETQQTSDLHLQLTVADQPSGAIEPRFLCYNKLEDRWHLFHEHQREKGEADRGFLMAL